MTDPNTDKATAKPTANTAFKLSDPIIFVVGTECREIWLPSNAVTRSPFLKAALDWPTEIFTNPRKIRLEGIRADDFEVYGNWVLSKNLQRIPEWKANKHFSERLINLWLLGDFLQDNEFKHCIIDSIFERHCEGSDSPELKLVPNVQVVARKWLEIPENSGLYRMLLDMFVGLGPSVLEGSRDFFRGGAGSAFMFELCLREKRTKHWSGMEQPYKYYDMNVNRTVIDNQRKPECLALE